MSQVKLTLRPPPNVDFVHGYPGIPPAGDRPQAAVKGAIEVRVGQQGVKAKWVRIELRKVETLPGGSPNTFVDFVGPSPVNLWQASDEYAILQTRDFPFYIRIPESIPPSIALENRAGIKYELVAAVCTKGKKGFLRGRKSTVTSTTASIIIDKHELHSTWPVYCQPERRHLAQEGVNLIVERSQTCYGPGDRVSVHATLRSDSLHTVILRGFELTLKETTIFRMGPFVTAKKSAPLVRHNIIGENKFPVNATLYGGTEHRAELSCDISQRHTTTSINAARHIDITYVLSVKALMGTGTHLIMDLPIIVSNWPRNVSVEAIRRIGPAMSLSLLPANSSSEPPRQNPAPVTGTQPSPPKADMSLSYSYPGRSNTGTAAQTYASVIRSPPSTGYGGSLTGSTVSNANNTTTKPNDFSAYTRPIAKINTTVDHSNLGNKPSQPVTQKPFVSDVKVPLDDTSSKTAPRPARPSVNATNRLTVTNNPDEQEIPKIKPPQAPKHAHTPSNGASSRPPWPTAEEEKKRLYDSARANVERVQGGLARGASANQPVTQSPPSQSASVSKPVAQGDTTSTSRTTRNTPWPTAEDEKLRLFNEAQATARKTQAMGSQTSSHGRSGSDSSRIGPNLAKSTNPNISKPDMTSTTSSPFSYATQSKGAGGSGSGPVDNRTKATTSPQAQYPAKVNPTVPQYPSAADEKAALKRYRDAKSAVDRTQGFYPGSDGESSQEPISYDALYPSTASASGSMSRSAAPVDNDLPPPFDASIEKQSGLSEKERLRRAIEARDAVAVAALGRQGGLGNIATSSYDSRNVSPPPFTNGGSGVQSARDMARPPPAAPAASGSRVLSAAEEKALLKVKYDGERRAVMNNGTAAPSVASSAIATPRTPPPLAPRPPAEYIQETQEEDARVSRYVQQGLTPPLDMPPINGGYKSFSPMVAGFDLPTPGPPPPLHGKINLAD